jgi:hypothetical protein
LANATACSSAGPAARGATRDAPQSAHPHFLFNTLNASSALVDIDPRGVRRIIARLSELMRATIEPTTEAKVPLGRELALLEACREQGGFTEHNYDRCAVARRIAGAFGARQRQSR